MLERPPGARVWGFSQTSRPRLEGSGGGGGARKKSAAAEFFCKTLEIDELPPHEPGVPKFEKVKPLQNRKLQKIIEEAMMGEQVFYLMPKLDGWRVTVYFFLDSAGKKNVVVKQSGGNVIEELSVGYDKSIPEFFDLSKIPIEIFKLTCKVEGELYGMITVDGVDQIVGFNGVVTALKIWSEGIRDSRYQNPDLKLRIGMFNLYSLGPSDKDDSVFGGLFEERSKSINFLRKIFENQPNSGVVFCGGLYCKDGQVYKDKAYTSAMCRLENLEKHIWEKLALSPCYKKQPGFGEGFVMWVKGPAKYKQDKQQNDDRTVGRDQRAVKIKEPMVGVFQVTHHHNCFEIFDKCGTVATLSKVKYGHLLYKLFPDPAIQSCIARIYYTWADDGMRKITGVQYASPKDLLPNDTELCNLPIILTGHSHYNSVRHARQVLRDAKEKLEAQKKCVSKGGSASLASPAAGPKVDTRPEWKRYNPPFFLDFRRIILAFIASTPEKKEIFEKVTEKFGFTVSEHTDDADLIVYCSDLPEEEIAKITETHKNSMMTMGTFLDWCRQKKELLESKWWELPNMLGVLKKLGKFVPPERGAYSRFEPWHCSLYSRSRQVETFRYVTKWGGKCWYGPSLPSSTDYIIVPSSDEMKQEQCKKWVDDIIEKESQEPNHFVYVLAQGFLDDYAKQDSPHKHPPHRYPLRWDSPWLIRPPPYPSSFFEDIPEVESGA